MSALAPPDPTLAAPARTTIEDGVIEEARRRQRRRRALVGAAAALALTATLLAALLHTGGGAPRPAPLASAASPTPLSGPPLAGATHLTLVVSENGGAVSLVDVDHHRARTLPGLGFARAHGPQVSLAAYRAGVLATVTGWSCEMWVSCAPGQASYPDRQSQFLISAAGAVRRISSFALSRHQYTTPAFHSTATWVSTWPHRGPCALALAPGAHPGVRVPCGAIGPDTAGGLWIDNGGLQMLVDPRTGAVLEREHSRDVRIPLPGGFALESAAGGGVTPLTLVNLATGTRRQLGWPSSLTYGYQVYPAPQGRLVALEFADPFHPVAGQSVNQAADVWVLDTATATLTHIPGFPALELLKQSGLAWTPQGELVLAARGGGRTLVAVWKPGQATLPLRAVPQLHGYAQFVALSP